MRFSILRFIFIALWLSVSSAEETSLTGELNDNLIYENCKPDDTLYDEPLHEIVGWAFKAMGITTDSGSDSIGNPLQSYYKYVKLCHEMLGGSEPIHRHLKLKSSNKQVIIQEMLDLLPSSAPPKLKALIEKAAEFSVGHVDSSSSKLKKVFYHKDTKSFERSEFVVMKIFKSGVELQIIPTYMSVKGSKEEEAILTVFRSTRSESELQLKSEKFILTKYDIKEIISEIRNVKGKWKRH